MHKKAPADFGRGFWMLLALLVVCRKQIAGIAKRLIQKIG